MANGAGADRGRRGGGAAVTSQSAATSSRFSPKSRRRSGWWVPAALAEDGTEITLADNGLRLSAQVQDDSLLRPDGGAAARMSFEFLAPDAARPETGGRPRFAAQSSGPSATRVRTSPTAPAAGGDGRNPTTELAVIRESVGVADLSYLGKLELQAEPGIVSIVAELTGGGTVAPGQASVHEGLVVSDHDGPGPGPESA